MYVMVLEINQKCNLRCKYCYLGEQDQSEMTFETAKKSIEFAFNQAEHHADKTIEFSFIGGEVFLSKDLLFKIVHYIKKKNSENLTVKYALTTNATLLNEEIIDWLIQNDFSMKVSIDGSEEIHDLNRVNQQDRGSFNRVINNLHLIKRFEAQSGKDVQVTSVITKNNYQYYAKSIQFIVEDLAVKFVDPVVDLCSEWNEDELNNLFEEINETFNYFERRTLEGKGFKWSFMNELVSSVTEKKRFYSCGAGIVSSYIRADGSIYACIACFNEAMKLGNVHVGLDNERLEILKKFDSIDNETCNQCAYYKYCSAKGCMMRSHVSNGNINEPDKILCSFQKFKVSFAKKNFKRLEEIYKVGKQSGSFSEFKND